MLPAILISALAAAQAPAAPAPGAGTPIQNPQYCLNTKIHQADADTRAKVKSLGELPPGNAYLAVDFRVNRCQVPVMIRYRIGGGGR